MIGVALVFGLSMLLGLADDLPLARFHPIIAVIQVIITVAYVAGADPANDIRLFYLWATPYAVFFFSSRAAALHTAWVAACMTAALVIMDPPFGVGLSIWLMTLGTVAAVWSVVAWATRGMRDSERRLRHAATHDALTGLPNRVLFHSRCTEALERVAAGGGRVIVLLVDLDRFKVVNDTFGHHAGDELLSVVAPRMHNAVRATDMVARLGGDEFAVVIEDVHGTIDPEIVAGHLADALAEPVPHGPARALHERRHRPRGELVSRRHRHLVAAGRRRRHVPGQGAGPGPDRRVRPRDAGRGPRPGDPGGPSALGPGWR